MGYYSSLTIKARGITTEKLSDIQKAAEELSGIELELEEDEDEDFSLWANAKWYDHQEFAKRLSKLFPDVEFQIHRVGEEVNEEWDEERYKVKDGKVYEEEVLEVSTRWRRREEEEIRAAEEYLEAVRRILGTDKETDKK